MKKHILSRSACFLLPCFVVPSFVLLCSALFSKAYAADYTIDVRGAHAFIQFRVKHLGYSWLYGRFNSFEGEFSFSENTPEKSTVSLEIDVASIDSNHAARDKHLRGDRYLNVAKYPKASFVSTAYKDLGDGWAVLTGDFTFYGRTKSIDIAIQHIGGGMDPWGGYRQGFEGNVTIEPKDWGLDLSKHLGPEAHEVELILSVEGIRKKELKIKK